MSRKRPDRQVLKFGERLRYLRRESGMRQQDLAKKILKNPETIESIMVMISYWETGSRIPTLGNIVRLAKGLDVSISELMGEDR